jgi:hypothetical protein
MHSYRKTKLQGLILYGISIFAWGISHFTYEICKSLQCILLSVFCNINLYMLAMTHVAINRFMLILIVKSLCSLHCITLSFLPFLFHSSPLEANTSSYELDFEWNFDISVVLHINILILIQSNLSTFSNFISNFL